MLYNQNTAEKINQTVKVVTIITLLFLPIQFVAVSAPVPGFLGFISFSAPQTFFGMNFILFNEATGSIQVSRDVWIFVVSALPVTAIILAIWWRVARSNAQKAKRPEHGAAASRQDDMV